VGLLSDALVLSALFAMAVATSIAVITSYYFYRWRRFLSLEGNVVTIPEELIARIAAVSKELRAIQSTIVTTGADQTKQDAQLSQQIEKTNKSVSQLFETMVSLQTALDQRDAEIKRLKQGYDAELIRRFVARFIRVKTAILDADSNEAANPNTINQISRLLDDALDECGVEEFRPRIGEDFRLAAGVADNPRVVETKDANQNFKIVDVLEPGFRFRNRAKDDIIISAKVSIFVARSSGA
jgi:molecular chaperone GrpE (heat shock protein)